MTENIMVIDGHLIDCEKNKLSIINDVREVYEENLSKTFSTCKDAISNDNLNTINTNALNIIADEKGRNVIEIDRVIYEILSGECLSIKLLGQRGTIFECKTDTYYKLDKDKYSTALSMDRNDCRYYNNGLTTVISSNLTHRILKYSTSEIINEHIYTKFYQYFETPEISVFLLLIDYKPYGLTCYYDFGKKHYNFNFIYKKTA